MASWNWSVVVVFSCLYLVGVDFLNCLDICCIRPVFWLAHLAICLLRVVARICLVLLVAGGLEKFAVVAWTAFGC